MRTFIRMTALALFALSFNVHASDVSEYQFRNGLKLIVKEDHRAPVAIFQIWYKVGASYEPGGITGSSHVLEHMMFKGTHKHPVGEFSRIIAEHGGTENAFTGQDYTAYFQKLESSRIPISFKLESDRMQHLNLLEKEFKKELQVVMEERRMRTDDNPMGLLQERFAATAHIANPYHNPTIGWMNDLENLTLNDLKKWYQTWYAPNNATIVIVGDVSPREVYRLAKKHFSTIGKSTLPTLKPQAEPAPRGKRTVFVKAPAKLPALVIGFNTPSLKTADDKSDAYALEVLAGILDIGASSRIEKHLVRGKHIASSASASYDLYTRFSGLFELRGVPAHDQSIDNLKSAFFDEIKQLKATPVHKKELERVKAQVIADHTFAKDSLFYQAMQIGLLETIGLSWTEADNYVNQIQEITAEQIQDVAKKYLIHDRMTVAELQPQHIESTVVKGKLNEKQI